ncbi:hypothetical protein WDW37_02255 [Bdellovibrionota bacterium FG-1]
MSFNKAFLPAVLGLVFGLILVSGWVSQILQRSFRTHGNVFSQYAPKPPIAKLSAPSEAPWCNPAYKMRWAGCNLR